MTTNLPNRPIIVMLVSTLMLVGCGRVSWQQTNINEVPEQGNWYLNGGMLFVTPKAQQTYEKNAKAMLSQYIGSAIQVPFPEGQYYVDNEQHTLGSGEFLFRPKGLTITPIESENQIQIQIKFDNSGAAIPFSDEGCLLTVSVKGLSVNLKMSAVRDLSGTVAMITTGDIQTKLGDVTTEIGPECTKLSDDGAFSMRGTSEYITTKKIQSQFNQKGIFVDAVEQMMTAMMVGHPMGQMTVEIPDSNESNSMFRLAVMPMSNDGVEPVVIVASNRVVTPMKIGLQSKPNSCIEHLDLPESTMINQVTPPDIPNGQSDVVLALRRTLVDDVFHGLFSAGIMCSNVGFETPSQLVLSQIANLLEANPSSVIDPNAPVSIRLWPESIPVFDISSSQLTTEMKWDKVRVELYVRHWDTDWSVFNKTIALNVEGLKPVLKKNNAIHLTGGTFKAIDSSGEAHSELMELAFKAITDNMQILQLPNLYPYPLTNAKFELVNDYIVMYADLDTNTVPDKRVITAGATQPPATNNVTETDGSGCHVASIKTPHSPMWAWAFEMVLVLVGIVALRRNDAR